MSCGQCNFVPFKSKNEVSSESGDCPQCNTHMPPPVAESQRYARRTSTSSNDPCGQDQSGLELVGDTEQIANTELMIYAESASESEGEAQRQLQGHSQHPPGHADTATEDDGVDADEEEPCRTKDITITRVTATRLRSKPQPNSTLANHDDRYVGWFSQSQKASANRVCIEEGCGKTLTQAAARSRYVRCNRCRELSPHPKESLSDVARPSPKSSAKTKPSKTKSVSAPTTPSTRRTSSAKHELKKGVGCALLRQRSEGDAKSSSAKPAKKSTAKHCKQKAKKSVDSKKGSLKKKEAKKGKDDSPKKVYSRTVAPGECESCGSTQTPLWRMAGRNRTSVNAIEQARVARLFRETLPVQTRAYCAAS